MVPDKETLLLCVQQRILLGGHKVCEYSGGEHCFHLVACLVGAEDVFLPRRVARREDVRTADFRLAGHHSQTGRGDGEQKLRYYDR